MGDFPKSLEELDKVIKTREQERVKEYNKRKWFAAASLFGNAYGPISNGISIYRDLIEKDSKFWYKVILLLFIAALLILVAIYLNINSFYLLIVPVAWSFIDLTVRKDLVSTIIISIISAAATLFIFSLIMRDFHFPQSFYSQGDRISLNALALILVYIVFLALFTKLFSTLVNFRSKR